MGSNTPPQHVAALVDYVRRAEVGLDEHSVRSAVLHVAPNPNIQGLLRRHLGDDPDALASGNPRAPQVVQRLLQSLIEAGAQGIQLPSCQQCSRTRPLVFSLPDGRRVCRQCRENALAHACGRCGKIRYCSHKLDGITVCGVCYRADPRTFAVCESCAQHQQPVRRTDTGVLCARCAPTPSRQCFRCKQLRPPSAILMRGPICRACYSRLQRYAAPCPGCRQPKVLAYLDSAGHDVCADCAGQPSKFGCEDCGSEQDLVGRRCARCMLTERLTRLLSSPDGRSPDDLAQLLSYLNHTRNSRSTLRWLSRGAGAEILRAMGSGQIALSHAGIDQLPASRPREFIRHMLIDADILRPRPVRLETTLEWIENFITDLPETHQKILRPYVRWQIARQLRAKAAADQLTWHSAQNARDRMHALAGFLTWLDTHGLALERARQHDVDHYLSTTANFHLAPFLRWAHKAGLSTTLTAPARGHDLSTRQAFDEERWEAVERLLHEDTIRIDTRVCGLFVLLYGQQLVRICRMTTDQITIDADVVTVRFSSDPITMPPLADDLVRRLLARPTSLATPAGDSNTWLFPGRLPGQPIDPGGLGVRLKKAGIRVRPARTTALMQLATELPSPVLATLLGLHPQTAVTWRKIAAGDWNLYPALRKEPSTEPNKDELE